MMNITIVGHVGQDAEIKSPKGDNKPFVSFSVAVNEGTDEDKTVTWFSCITPHEKLARHLTKGSQVTVVGRLSINKGNDGRIFYNVRASDITPTWQKKDDAAPRAAPAAAQYDKHDAIPF